MNTNEIDLPKAIIYVKINQDRESLCKKIQVLEKYCYENYIIVDYYIDLINKQTTLTPQYGRLMDNVMRQRYLCDVLVVLNANQFGRDDFAISTTRRIVGSAGIQIVEADRGVRLLCRNSTLDLVESDYYINIDEDEGRIEKVTVRYPIF